MKPPKKPRRVVLGEGVIQFNYSDAIHCPSCDENVFRSVSVIGHSKKPRALKIGDFYWNPKRVRLVAEVL